MTDFKIEDEFKILEVEIPIKTHYCPKCGERMYSKGITIRTARHPIFQDGYKLLIKVKQRRWKCINDECKFTYNDKFNFLGKYKQLTNITPFLVIEDLKDIELTCAQVADRYNISSQAVHNWFMERIHIGRSKLTYMIKRYEYEIIASFKIINQNIDGIELTRRLSNGPMESFNRKSKDLKRASREFSNFDYVRNRIM